MMYKTAKIASYLLFIVAILLMVLGLFVFNWVLIIWGPILSLWAFMFLLLSDIGVRLTSLVAQVNPEVDDT